MSYDYIYGMIEAPKIPTMEELKGMIAKIKNPRLVKFAGYEFEAVVHPAMKDSAALVICGDKGYYWHDIFEANEVKIVEIEDMINCEPKLPFAPYLLDSQISRLFW